MSSWLSEDRAKATCHDTCHQLRREKGFTLENENCQSFEEQ